MATGHGAAASHGDGEPDDASSASAFSCDSDEVENAIKESDWQDAPRGDGNHAPRGNGNQHAQQEKSGPFQNTIAFLAARKNSCSQTCKRLGRKALKGQAVTQPVVAGRSGKDVELRLDQNWFCLSGPSSRLFQITRPDVQFKIPRHFRNTFSQGTPALRKAAGCEGIRAAFRRPRWRLET